ncbi:HAD family hydrolase [Streptomyces sp. LP11]|uniref:HAD family hydrolase n=1 Tax=Streptomyces pyxinicus TaxID=2970331 RepID=A0ABT2AYL8_9ACTN|nr:HAD family hydrolase [Streptomyces sp. LP11]MCS0601361.1 HAD family hydrolase [Streptomyces sp. LP11]
MSSERSPEPSGTGEPSAALARLADVLEQASRGTRPTPLELAELLWLAGQMSDAGDGGAVPVRRAAPPPPVPPVPPAPDRTPPLAAPAPAGRVPLHLPARQPAPAAAEHRPHTGLLAPAPPMLRHPLALQRALRPLRRRTDAPVGHELDERATADRIAHLGADPAWWLPVLRPARERWLRLNLVYDAGPTMPVWQPLLRELHTALAQSGAFRTVALFRATADGTVHGPGAAAHGDGRTVTLLVSDCMGPQWREGPAGRRWYATLHRWARRMPLAVVQPLPEHLWRDTALPTAPGRLTAPYPAAPSAALTFEPYEPYEPCGGPEFADGTVPLPVLEPEPRWLAHWAGLLTAPGGARFPAAVAGLGRPLPADAEDRTDVARLSAEELVLRFRATASPEAFRLAGHLALGRPDLPVMRLVQAAVEPDPRPRQLAEVVLSGMLTAVPGAPPGCYAFRDGVRELLLLGLPRTARNRTTELLRRVGELIEDRAGRAPGEFRASVPSGRGPGTAVAAEPFATVDEDSARRLAGATGGPAPGEPAVAHGEPHAEPSPADPPGLRFTADALAGRPEARITLEAAVHEVLARSALAPGRYTVEVRPDGYLVRTEPGAFLLPALVAALRELPRALRRLDRPPRVRVTFGPDPAVPVPDPGAGVLVVVPPALYDDFSASSAARGTPPFRPLHRAGAPDAAPTAWYCALGQTTGEPTEQDLVRGPFIIQDLRELGLPTPGRTAVVHTRPDGPLTLLDPLQPYGTRPPRPETYYTVDLTPHQARHTLSLPGAGAGAFTAVVDLSWEVADPVAVVRAEASGVPGLLLERLRTGAASVTRRHPVRRAGAAGRQVNEAVRDWPVPGLAVSYRVRLAPEGRPLPETERPAPGRRRTAALLGDAEAVLIGFDGPLARLFPGRTARAAVVELLSLVAEDRDPAGALAGRPLPVVAEAGREAFAHPLDLLRAFARDPAGPALAARLAALELAAVPDAPTTHRALPLVRALHRSGRRVGVVTDVSAPAVRGCLEPYRLPLACVQGRRDDLGLLMPDPDGLDRALAALGTPVPGAVLIGSSVAELTAAQRLGLRFVGFAPTAAGRRRLREEGSGLTVSSLEPLLEAARAL